MAQPTASIQLIVFGARNQTDLPGVLKEVAAAGFPAIEAGNLFLTIGEESTRQLLSANNLGLSGAHFGYGEYTDDARVESHIAYAKAMGIKNLMCSGVADSKSVAGYRQSAQLFNSLGKRLAEEGITFHYHNHAWEFTDLGGVNGMEVLSQETDPALVKFNVDVYWVWYGAKDPVEFINQHADRVGYYHFKDGTKYTDNDGITRPEFRELGTGEVDLKAAYAAALQHNAQWIVAEQDHTTLVPVDSATISRAYIKTELGI